MEAGSSRYSFFSPSFKRLLPWLSALVLIGGIVAIVVALTGNSGSTLPDTRSNEPAVIPTKSKPGKLPRAARLTAADFVKTAVLRQNLDRAWQLAGPPLKQGLTLREWRKGDIPVVPFPKKYFLLASSRVDYVHSDRALMEVSVLSKDDAKVKSQIFYVELQRYGKGPKARWLVVSWVPRGAPRIPLPTS